MNIVLKSMAIAVTLLSGLQAMDAPEKNLGYLIGEISLEILKKTSKDQILDLGNKVSFEKSFGNLRLVCRNWQRLVNREIDPNKVDFIKDVTWKEKKKGFFVNSLILAYGTIGYGDICRIFLNGELVYTPKQDMPQTKMLIADLEAPFQGEFDLSKYENAGGEGISISTGNREKFIAKNKNKIEIWFTPWFVIKNNTINNAAKNLEAIFTNLNNPVAPIAIIFNWGGYDNIGLYEYLTNYNLDTLSSNNLIQLLDICRTSSQMKDPRSLCTPPMQMCSNFTRKLLEKFHVYFK